MKKLLLSLLVLCTATETYTMMPRVFASVAQAPRILRNSPAAARIQVRSAHNGSSNRFSLDPFYAKATGGVFSLFIVTGVLLKILVDEWRLESVKTIEETAKKLQIFTDELNTLDISTGKKIELLKLFVDEWNAKVKRS